MEQIQCFSILLPPETHPAESPYLIHEHPRLLRRVLTDSRIHHGNLMLYCTRTSCKTVPDLRPSGHQF